VTELLQAVILGLLIGGVYALMASGLTLVFGVMNIINVAQGAFLIMVAMITWWLWKHTGIDPILASVITTPMMFGFGWVLYRTVIVRIRGASPSMSVLLTFGLALTIEGILNITAAAVVVLAALYVVLIRTWTGRAIRAASQNPSGAALVGVGATSTAALAFAIGSSTAGVGGSILSVLYPFFPASHYDWISRLLGIIVLGGMGSLPGALVGALVLGLAETLTATYGSLRWATLVFYIVILAVLLFRPQGIYGTRLREDVAV
jgi:branched-chain amino acid transport system permease protein